MTKLFRLSFGRCTALTLPLLLVAAGQLSARGVTVVGETAAPIVGISVRFFNASGSRDVERTDGRGYAAPPAAFGAVRAEIHASTYQSAAVALLAQNTRVVLEHTFPIIGNVSVATGTTQDLHALTVPASLLDRASIAASPEYATDGILGQLPGFDRTRSNSAFTNYGQLRVSFGGAGNDRGLVLANGIPAEDGFGGQIDWAAYPPSVLERAELLRAPGSALYGAGAIGGVLELSTFAPNADPYAGADLSASLAAGTHGMLEQWVNARTPLGGKLTAAFSAQRQRLAYFDLPPGFQSPIDQIAQSQSSMAAARFRYQASPADVFEFGASGAWDGQLEGRPHYTFTRRLTQLSAAYLHQTAASLVTARVFTRSGFITNEADRYPAMPGVPRYTQDVPTTEGGAALSWIVQSAHNTFAARADYRAVRGTAAQYFPTGALQNLGSGNQTLEGIAAQETIRAGRLEVVGGLRFDEIAFFNGKLVNVKKGIEALHLPADRFDRAVSPRFAARYALTPQLNVRASIGSGFRAPYLNELLRSFVIGSITYQGNPSLVPERSSGASAGLDWADSRQRLSLDFNDTLVHDALMFRTISPTIQQRSNVAQTRTDGAIVTYAHRVGSCSRASAWGTAQDARVVIGPATIVGKRLQYVPEASVGLAYDGRAGAVGFDLHASYLGQTYADDLNMQRLGTAVVAGARVRVPLSPEAALMISAQNLTGARYLSSPDRYGLPAIVSLSLDLSPAAAGGSGCLP